MHPSLAQKEAQTICASFCTTSSIYGGYAMPLFWDTTASKVRLSNCSFLDHFQGGPYTAKSTFNAWTCNVFLTIRVARKGFFSYAHCDNRAAFVPGERQLKVPLLHANLCIHAHCKQARKASFAYLGVLQAEATPCLQGEPQQTATDLFTPTS